MTVTAGEKLILITEVSLKGLCMIVTVRLKQTAITLVTVLTLRGLYNRESNSEADSYHTGDTERNVKLQQSEADS